MKRLPLPLGGHGVAARWTLRMMTWVLIPVHLLTSVPFYISFAARTAVVGVGAYLLSSESVEAQGTPPSRLPNFPTGSTVPSDPGGYMGGSFGVDDLGAAVGSIPIWVPPGRAGMQPSLSLVYNSNGGNGSCGVGWSLSGGSEITRVSKVPAAEGTTRWINYNGGDSFAWDGKRLVEVPVEHSTEGGGQATTFEYRTEEDGFTKIMAYGDGNAIDPKNPVSWKVRAKGGRILEYEAVTAAQYNVVDGKFNTPAAASQVKMGNDDVRLKWVCTKESDRSGNYIRYEWGTWQDPQYPYACSVQLSKIEWTFSDVDGSVGKRSIFIQYDERPDKQFWYQNGVRYLMDGRITSLEIKAPVAPGSPSVKVGSYQLAYEQSIGTGRSLLKSVTQLDGEGVPLWSKRFDWSESFPKPVFEKVDRDIVGFTICDFRNFSGVPADGCNENGGPDLHPADPGDLLDPDDDQPADPGYHDANRDIGMVVADFDHDGKDDLLFRRWYDSAQLLLSKLEPLGSGPYTNPFGGDIELKETFPVDVDGDGELELYTKYDLGEYNTAYSLLKWDENSSSFQDYQANHPVLSFGGGFNSEDIRLLGFTDINGDGLADMMAIDVDSADPTNNKGDYTVRLNKKTNWEVPFVAPGVIQINDDGIGPTYTDPEKEDDYFSDNYMDIIPVMFDFDGDGRGDMLKAMKNSNNGQQMFDRTAKVSMPLDSDGVDSVLEKDGRGPFLGIGYQTIRMDINGDGLAENIIPSANPLGIADPGSVLAGAPPLLVGQLTFPPPAQTMVQWNTGQGFIAPVPLLDHENNSVGFGKSDAYFFDCSYARNEDGKWHAYNYRHLIVDDGARVGDFNGDGREDLVIARGPEDLINGNEEGITLFLSNGSGLEKAPLEVALGANEHIVKHKEQGYNHFRLGDFNGDGLVDMVYLVEENTDETYVSEFVSLKLRMLLQQNISVTDKIKKVWNEKDPAPTDIFVYQRELSSGSIDGLDNLPLEATGGFAVNRIYRHFPVVRQHWVWQGDDIGTLADGIANSYRGIWYEYLDPGVDIRGRGLLGFAREYVWDSGVPGFTITEYTDRLQSQTHPTSLKTIYPGAFRPKKVTHIVPILEQPVNGPQPTIGFGGLSGTVRGRVTKTEYEYKVKWSEDGQTYFIHPDQTTTTESEEDVEIDPGFLDNGNAGAVTATGMNKEVFRTTQQKSIYDNNEGNVYSYASDFGNMTSSWTEVTAGPGGSGDTRSETECSYINDTDNWLIGLKEECRGRSYPLALAGSPPDWRITSYEYESGIGLLKMTHEDPPHPLTKETTVLTRNSYGLVEWHRVFVDGLTERGTHFTYDNENMFVQSASNLLGHKQEMWTHPAFGVPLTIISVDGIKTSLHYDGFGRLIEVEPDNGMKVTHKYWGDQIGASGYVRGMIHWISSEDNSEAKTHTNVNGRKTLESVRGFDGQWIGQRYYYNHLGSLTRVTNPGIFGGDGGEVPSANETVFTSDTLGRPLSVVEPNAATTLYNPQMYQVDLTDPNGNQSYQLSDVMGRVIQSVDILEENWPANVHIEIPTTYQYGVFGQLDKIIDAHGNITRFDYHPSRGWRTGVHDPDNGVITTEYNGYGEVRQVIDELSTTLYDRDAIGRVTQKQYTKDGATEVTSYVYDVNSNMNNAVGKLAKTTSPDGTMVDYVYHPTTGLPIATKYTIGNKTYTVMTAYDDKFRVNTLIYPKVPAVGNLPNYQFKVQQTYNNYGYPEEIKDISDNAAPVSLWKVDERNEYLALKKGTFGNGKESVQTYDPLNGRLTGFSVGNVGLNYTYYLNGNLHTRVDPMIQREETFEYDTLDRLKHWELTLPGGGADPAMVSNRHTFYDYDNLGNLTGETVDNQAVYSATYGWQNKPHALATSNGAASYFYDDLGRQTFAPVLGVGGVRVVDYNSFDLPKTITQGSVTTSFLYTAGGQRIKKTSTNGKVTTYIGGLYEKRETVGDVDHIFYVHGVDGEVVAQVNYDQDVQGNQEKVTLYLQNDHLGSVGYVMTGGNEGLREYFNPFGQAIAVDGAPLAAIPGNVKVGFTGHDHDDDLGLINMRGRMYDPNQRRFFTPDPVLGSPLSSQGHNRYGYVRNNPLKYTDPSGFWEEGSAGSVWSLESGGWDGSTTWVNESGYRVTSLAPVYLYGSLNGGANSKNKDLKSRSEGATSEQTTEPEMLGGGFVTPIPEPEGPMFGFAGPSLFARALASSETGGLAESVAVGSGSLAAAAAVVSVAAIAGSIYSIHHDTKVLRTIFSDPVSSLSPAHIENPRDFGPYAILNMQKGTGAEPLPGGSGTPSPPSGGGGSGRIPRDRACANIWVRYINNAIIADSQVEVLDRLTVDMFLSFIANPRHYARLVETRAFLFTDYLDIANRANIQRNLYYRLNCQELFGDLPPVPRPKTNFLEWSPDPN